MDYLSMFDVQVRVQRAFSFEELQSGSYFNSLDDSDIQFYRVYGQPVLIPPQDNEASYVLHAADHACDSGLHVVHPSVYSYKSYTLQDPLGEGRAQASTAQPAPRLTTPHDWPSVKQEPTESLPTYPNPALPAIASQLYTLPDLDETSTDTPMRYLHDQPLYSEPPMDSLPFPPPNAVSPPYFQASPQSQSTSDGAFHDATRQPGAGRDQWEDVSPRHAVPHQSYILGALPSPAPPALSQSLTQQYTPSSGSVTRSHRRHSRTPSPPAPMSPAPSSKRSQDKKPALACLFCRGRKIACGPPQPGSKDKTCNQCARRHLKCEYPLESRRGMRKRRSLIPRTSTPEINSDGTRVHIVKANRKRSVDKSS